jgi:hypothetical protein
MDRTDRPTFNTRAVSFFDYIKNNMWSDMTAFVTAAYSNALDAAASAVAAAASAVAGATSASNAAASAVTAGASAGATAWNAGTAYTLGQRAIDPTFQRVYFRKIAGTTATQPNADGTNWGPLDISEVVVPVAGTTGTVYAGATWSLNNAAATAMTLDAAIADSSEFAIILRNGRTDNTLDIGTKTLNGPGGSITGVITFDTSTRVWSFKYIAATTSLEII